MARQILLWLGAAAIVAMPIHAPGRAQTPLVSTLQQVVFTIDDVPYQIMMPVGARLEANARPGCAKVWHPRSMRQMNFMELCPSSSASARSYATERKLTNDAVLRFSIESDLGGGSGGTESELAGRLDINGKALAVVCRHQSEWYPDPSWCINYLGYLKVDDRK
jgi:hypothetical protein